MSRYLDSLPTPVQVVGLALSDWWDDWVNMVVINLLWWLCWLTVVLGPPATFGMYYATNQLAHGSRLGLMGFFAGITITDLNRLVPKSNLSDHEREKFITEKNYGDTIIYVPSRFF